MSGVDRRVVRLTTALGAKIGTTKWTVLIDAE